jgi:hypothetical protein
MTMSGDRLTRLPDNVLRQVLSHAPAKEAVCTGALSRPWRSLWLSSGVLNLDSRSYGAGPMRYSRSLVFLHDANAALRAFAAAAAEDGENSLRKLTFTYLAIAPNKDEDMYWSRRHIDGGLDELLSKDPAARELEELRVHVSRDCYSLSIAALPSDALRELHLDGLSLTPPLNSHRQSPSFARLETLRLRRCDVRVKDIQAIVDAAPLLAALELDRVYISPDTGGTGQRQLRFPRVTVLSLGNMGGWYWDLELEVPSLQRFSYRGFLQAISFVPPPASMARADLHFDLDFFSAGPINDRRKAKACELFWQFVGSFSSAEVLNVSFEQPEARRTAKQISYSSSSDSY